MTNMWQPVASKELIYSRARMLKSMRAFFDERGVIEVESPLLSSACTTDPNLDSLETEFQSKPYYLNTSPEFFMKRMLAIYRQPIYQICKSFRDDELGPNHNPEFTMLEWYRPDMSYHQLMDEVAELWQSLVGEAEVDEPLAIEGAGHGLEDFNPTLVVLDQVVVGGEDRGDLALAR